jgi:hypothetical protein
MAEEINNQDNQTDGSWSPFDGLGPYRGEDSDSDQYLDTMRVREEEPDSPFGGDTKQARQQTAPQQEEKKESAEEEKKGGGVLEPFFDNQEYFEDAKGEEDVKPEDGEAQQVSSRGRRPATLEDKEAQEINALFDVFVEDYGWQDIPKESRPRTAREFSEFVSAVIAENSKPAYAHPELQALDQFVREGGDLSTYFKSVAEMNYDTMTLNSEYDQKRAVAEVLRLQGFGPEQIKHRVENYAKGGVLYDEAQYALAQLKMYSQQHKQATMQQQYQQLQQEQALTGQFIDVTAQTLRQMNDVMGAQLTNKDRRELFEYMFKQDQNGHSQFVKDYSSNPVNIITAAYLCKFGNEAFRRMDSGAQKRAIDRFRETIAQQNTKSRGAARTAQRKSGELRFTDLAKI